MERINYPESDIAAANLHNNRLALAKRIGSYPEFTPPAPGHYWGLYLWDEGFHAIIDARHGSSDSLKAAQSGLKTLVRGQNEDTGFIPNFQEFGPRRIIEPERFFGFESAEQSNYIQPPVLALAVSEVHNALRTQIGVDHDEAAESAESFLQEMYPALKLFHRYLDKFRSNGPGDKRMFIIHPHETGRDSDPAFDYLKPYRLARDGIATSLLKDKTNAVLDYTQILAYGTRLRRANGDMQKARELCGALDIMMNCILARNLDIMAGLAGQLGKKEDAEYYAQYARNVENQILGKMWFSEERDGKGAFYAIDGKGQPIKEISISNLFPLVLPNLREEQLESLLDLLDTSFNTPYPLPSVATDSPNYDPYNREFDRLWRGGVWQNTNFYIEEFGLKMQTNRPELANRPDLIARGAKWDDRITRSSRGVLQIAGPREFYNPITGKGQRERVKNFAWSNLGYIMNRRYVSY